MLKLLLLSVIAIAYIEVTHACSCLPAPFQVKFCQAKFAIKARVLSEKLIFQNGQNATTDPAFNFALFRYRVRVIQVYKGKKYCGKKFLHIFTRGNSGLCGVRLTKFPFPPSKNVWLLTGTVDSKGRLFIGACDLLSRFYDLTLHQRISLKFGRYNKGCDCVKKGKLGCKIPKKHKDKKNCYDKYATCMKKGIFKKCRWLRGFRLWQCLKA